MDSGVELTIVVSLRVRSPKVVRVELSLRCFRVTCSDFVFVFVCLFVCLFCFFFKVFFLGELGWRYEANEAGSREALWFRRALRAKSLVYA